MTEDYISLIENLVGDVAARQGLSMATAGRSAMGEWYVRFENDEFILDVSRDRGGFLSIALGSRVRRRPRAHMRGPWSLSHLRGYLDGLLDHYRFSGPEDEANWLRANESRLFDTALLNSDELNSWAVVASRRLFGQD